MHTYRLYSFLAPNLLPLYESAADYLAHRLQCRMPVIVGERYEQVADADFCFICGLPYVLRTRPRRSPPLLHALAAPALAGLRYQARPIYFSDVIVRRDSRLQTFADLRGCSWAYNEPESQSGYGITRHYLVGLGETGGYFGEVIEAGFHQEAIRMVAEGKADAAAIDSHVLDIERRDQPELTQSLRVIATLGPSTIQPFAAANSVPPAVRRAARAALAEMHTEPAIARDLSRHLVERFVPVEDAAYDDIRAMLAACESADFLTLK